MIVCAKIQYSEQKRVLLFKIYDVATKNYHIPRNNYLYIELFYLYLKTTYLNLVP